MGAIMSSSIWLELALIFVGSIVVIIMGTKILKSSDNTELNANVEIPIKKVIATSCIVTWFNPQAIIDGSMVLGASKAAIPPEYGTAFIISCAAASAFWWFLCRVLFIILNLNFRIRFCVLYRLCAEFL